MFDSNKCSDHFIGMNPMTNQQHPNLDFIWPIKNNWNHNNVESVLERTEVKGDWEVFVKTIRAISWDEILTLHEAKHSGRMSISKALAEVINNKLMLNGSSKKCRIFNDGKDNSKPFLIEYKLGSLAIDISFGHYNITAWKLARLVVATSPNQNEMENQCKVGILILPEEELRLAGKFDSPSNWERAVDYLNYMGNQWQSPLLLIGLKNPRYFRIIDNGKGEKPRSSVYLTNL